MKILITGINGFIGQHLTIELIRRGHKVHGIEHIKDGVLDPKIVDKAITNVEIVVHLAALTSHTDIINNRYETLRINVQGTKNVLDAFSKSKKAKKFLYASTGKVYGKIINLPISENHPTDPLSILGKSKLITERLIDFYNDNKKEFIIFRIFNVYGPKQHNNFLIPTILSQLNEGKKQLSLGDIEAKRDYIYIDDLIRAFVLAIERKGKPGLSIYNICTNCGNSAKEIVKIIGRINNVSYKIRSIPKLIRSDEMKTEYGSYALAKKELNWEPTINLKEGLEKLIIK